MDFGANLPINQSADDVMVDIDQPQALASGDAATPSSSNPGVKKSKTRRSKVKKPKANNPNPFMPKMPNATKQQPRKRKAKIPKATRIFRLLRQDGLWWVKFGKYGGILDPKATRLLGTSLSTSFPNLDSKIFGREVAHLFQHATQHVHLLNQEKNPEKWWSLVTAQAPLGDGMEWMRQEGMPLALDNLACRAVLARTVYLSDSLNPPNRQTYDKLTKAPSATAIAVDAYIAAVRAGPGASDPNVRRNMLERYVAELKNEEESEQMAPVNKGSSRRRWMQKRLTVREFAVIVPTSDASNANMMCEAAGPAADDVERVLVGLFEAFGVDDGDDGEQDDEVVAGGAELGLEGTGGHGDDGEDDENENEMDMD